MTEEELFDLREEADGILTKIEADKDEMTIDDRTLDRIKKKMEKFINLTGSNAVFGKVKITISLPIYLDCEGEMFLKYHDESQLFDLLPEDKQVNDIVEGDVKIQKKLKTIIDEYNDFVTELHRIADDHKMELYEVWDAVDPDGHWH